MSDLRDFVQANDDDGDVGTPQQVGAFVVPHSFDDLSTSLWSIGENILSSSESLMTATTPTPMWQWPSSSTNDWGTDDIVNFLSSTSASQVPTSTSASNDESWLTAFSPATTTAMSDSHSTATENSSSSTSHTTNSQHVDNAPTTPASPPFIPRKRPRRQFRSCDPCRMAKCACDLQFDVLTGLPSKACTSCFKRDQECTTDWLATAQRQRKQRKQEAEQRAASTSTTELVPPQPSSISETNLAKTLMASTVSNAKCMTYFCVVELPMSHWLASECIMSPQPLEVAHRTATPDALLAKSVTQVFDADLLKTWWSLSCKDRLPQPPVLHALHVLDALLRLVPFGGRHTLFDANAGLSVAPQNALHLAVLAGAAQYSTTKDAAILARSLWHEAQTRIFTQLGETNSFRLAWALLSFGLVTPPPNDDGDDDGWLSRVKTADYAVKEGVQRLLRLCRFVRRRVKALMAQITEQDAQRVDRLAYILECLVLHLESVYIVTIRSCSALLPGSDSILSDQDDEESERDSEYDGKRHCNLLLNDRFAMQISTDASQARSKEHDDERSNRLTCSTSSDLYVWSAVVERSSQTSNAVKPSPSHSLLTTINHASACKALLWKAVADYTRLSRQTHFLRDHHTHHQGMAYRHPAYVKVINIIMLWHAAYGQTSLEAVEKFASLSKTDRTMLTFVCNHVALATLHFFDVATGVQGRLRTGQDGQRRGTRSLQDAARVDLPRKHHILCISAAQTVATMANLNMVQASDESPSLYPDLWQHPYPAMLLQAQHMAAFQLLHQAGRLQNVDGARHSSLLASAKTCLKAMDTLNDHSASIPTHVVDDRMTRTILNDLAAAVATQVGAA